MSAPPPPHGVLDDALSAAAGVQEWALQQSEQGHHRTVVWLCIVLISIPAALIYAGTRLCGRRGRRRRSEPQRRSVELGSTRGADHDGDGSDDEMLTPEGTLSDAGKRQLLAGSRLSHADLDAFAVRSAHSPWTSRPRDDL